MTDQDGNTSETYYEADPETGRIVEQYNEQEFLNALDQLSSDNSIPSTGDVARELDCNRETARLRLKDLSENNQIKKLESGAGYHWLPVEETE